MQWEHNMPFCTEVHYYTSDGEQNVSLLNKRLNWSLWLEPWHEFGFPLTSLSWTHPLQQKQLFTCQRIGNENKPVLGQASPKRENQVSVCPCPVSSLDHHRWVCYVSLVRSKWGTGREESFRHCPECRNSYLTGQAMEERRRRGLAPAS